MSKTTEEAIKDEDAKEEDYEFICPNCKKKVIDNFEYSTEGQQSEHWAGFRTCPSCQWHGKPKEVLEIMNQIDKDIEEDKAKQRVEEHCDICGNTKGSFSCEQSLAHETP